MFGLILCDFITKKGSFDLTEDDAWILHVGGYHRDDRVNYGRQPDHQRLLSTTRFKSQQW